MTRRSFRHLPAVAGSALALALISGCASTSTSPSLFVLDNAGPSPDHTTPAAAKTLLVAPVATASYLDQGGIVYQTGPHRVVIANDNRWASSLSGQLTDNLYATLDRDLSGVNVVRSDDNHSHSYQVQTRVDRFLGNYDGDALIAGRWTLVGPDGQTLASHDFSRSVKLATDGYPALVSSLSNGWQTVGADMARAMAPALGATTTGE